MSRHLLRLLLLIPVLVAAVPARAGLFDDDEARKQISEIRSQLGSQIAPRLEKLEAAAGNQLEFSNQIEALKSEIAKMRGQIEVLNFELESAQKRQKDFYVDLDNRLRKLESATAAAAPAPNETKAAPAVDPAAETRDYEAALNLFKAGKYKDSVAAFQNFIKTYPNGSFLPSAHYWAGNAFYQLREYSKATEMYNKVTLAWGNDAKAPDAMLGLANCQQETGDAKGARKTLEALLATYPSSPAADVARQRLKKKL